MTNLLDVTKTLAQYMFDNKKDVIRCEAELMNDGDIKIKTYDHGKEIDTDWYDEIGAKL